MNVGELIRKLNEFDHDMDVVIEPHISTSVVSDVLEYEGEVVIS